MAFPPFPPDPDDAGWLVFDPPAGGFSALFGRLRMRVQDDGTVRCRVLPGSHHRNVRGGIHGGFAMALVDQVLFMAPHARGMTGAIGGMTLNVSVEFFAPLATDAPVDAIVEILRETGRMIFMRGLIEQAGATGVAFSGTIRKASPTP